MLWFFFFSEHYHSNTSEVSGAIQKKCYCTLNSKIIDKCLCEGGLKKSVNAETMLLDYPASMQTLI